MLSFTSELVETANKDFDEEEFMGIVVEYAGFGSTMAKKCLKNQTYAKHAAVRTLMRSGTNGQAARRSPEKIPFNFSVLSMGSWRKNAIALLFVYCPDVSG
jgi:hypothetical protein